MIKNIRIPQEYINDTTYVDCQYASSIQDLLNVIPNGITPDQVYLDVDIEKGYYGYESAKLSIHYTLKIKNPNYENELKEYNKHLSQETYYKNHCTDYFIKEDEIQLPIGQILFLEKLELAPLKKSVDVKILIALPPISPNNNPMTDINWCQIVYFYIDDVKFNTLLYSKDIFLRKEYIDKFRTND